MALLHFPMTDARVARDRVATPPAPAVDDLVAARAGDRAAFVRLIRAYQSLAYGVALRVTGQRADAEELVQDAFLQLHGQLGAIADASHLKHWLMRTVSHRAIDRLRRNARDPGTGAVAAPDTLEAPAAGDDDPLLRRVLDRLLARLPGPARAVLVLRFQEDLDPVEIAATLEMPLNTVKSHLRRSLEWLRQAAPELDHAD